MNPSLPRRRLAALPLLLIPLILLGVGLQLQKRPAIESADLPRPPPEADYYLRGAELSSMGADGQLLYRVKAGTVLHYPDRSIELDEVSVDYLNGPWTLTAASGRIPPGEQTLSLSGNVFMQGTLDTTREQVELRTDRITIAFEQRTIQTDARVRMSSPTIQATATGMQTDLAGQELRLLADVEVRYEP